ncbi:MAG: alpha/beta hydrolase [Candidatus Sphingomonas phytovorans]|nr:alpha/beta hydrolase [Sphingomonas sp.]WEJ98473.1 MAG: alpha/beta hydrolase [Sphingomonas sp.]
MTSTSEAPDISVEALESLLGYARDRLDVDLDLQGGGTGCFDLVLGSNGDHGKAIEHAILNDPHFQVLLGEVNVNLARVRLGGGYQAYASHIRFNAGIATNRARNPNPAADDLRTCFNAQLADNVSFAVAEFHILDLARSPGTVPVANRIWKAITLTLGDIRNRREDYEVARIEYMAASGFETLLKHADAQSLILSLHGYANDFSAAMMSFAKFVDKTRIYQMGHFPILFSWPSPGEPMLYLSDTDVAANSQDPFASVVNLIGRAAGDRPIRAIAHSHGNKILVEVARDRANQGAKPLFKRMIFVEPDVNAHYMAGKLELLTAATSGMTFYHSENDRALAIAEMVFKGKRAGQTGVQVPGNIANIADIEVVDASRVAVGWTRHAPHVDAIQVIYDIRDVIEGKPPLKRGLIPCPGVGCWSIS